MRANLVVYQAAGNALIDEAQRTKRTPENQAQFDSYKRAVEEKIDFYSGKVETYKEKAADGLRLTTIYIDYKQFWINLSSLCLSNGVSLEPLTSRIASLDRGVHQDVQRLMVSLGTSYEKATKTRLMNSTVKAGILASVDTTIETLRKASGLSTKQICLNYVRDNGGAASSKSFANRFPSEAAQMSALY